MRMSVKDFDKIFSGKKALVVGGTGGIGQAISLGLAERGADLIIHGGSSRERLESAVKAVKAVGAKARGFLLPITDHTAAEEIYKRAAEPGCSAGQVDILVCAFGPFCRSSLDKTDAESWRFMAMGNLAFPGAMVSLVLPAMISKNWGRILLFGGTNTDTIRGFLTTTAYSAAKTGLGVIAKSTARSFGGQGITCNVICPGMTDTEYLGEHEILYNREKSPLGKALSPKNIAAVSLDILENPNINGAIIPVDKGICV